MQRLPQQCTLKSVLQHPSLGKRVRVRCPRSSCPSEQHVEWFVPNEGSAYGPTALGWRENVRIALQFVADLNPV